MAYEIKKLEEHVVSVSFNGKKPWHKFPVPFTEDGDYNKEELINFLNYVDSTMSFSPSNVAEVEALIPNHNKTNEECASCARQKRNLLLSMTDYTQMPDSSFSAEEKAAIAVARQELRDISSQAGFPTDIQWPAISTIDPVEYQKILDTDFCGG